MTTGEETETVETGDALDLSNVEGVLVPEPGARLMPFDGEDYESFRRRRTFSNKMVRFIASRQKGYRPATRLTSSGMRSLDMDMFANRPTVITDAERARRRAAGKLARRSRKVNW